LPVGTPGHVKAGKSLKLKKPDAPAFTQVIGQIALDFSAKTFRRLHNQRPIKNSPPKLVSCLLVTAFLGQLPNYSITS
jgi:hypothetical protein